MSIKLEISIPELESLLNQQKTLVIERLSQQTHVYNTESTDSHYKPLPIDKDKMKKYGMGGSLSTRI